MKKIVILASGNGSNAQAIIDFFKNKPLISVTLVLSNRADAHVLERARQESIPALSFNKFAFAKADTVLNILKSESPDLIVLAGFLWKIPKKMVSLFPQKIINIHPALLPHYGGKGMYGSHVHQAVIENKELQSGISIHYVNEDYDEGAMIKQVKVAIEPTDTPESLAAKIHQLEHHYLPLEIEKILS